MLCITMALIVAAVYYPALTAYIHREEKNAPLTGWWMVADFVSHVFMLHGFYPAFDFGGGNEVYWTLAREEYLYLLYLPLLMWRRTWGMARAIGAVVFLGLTVPIAAYLVTKILHLPQNAVYPVNMSNSAIALWAQWALGMVAVEAYFGTVKLPRWCSQLWMAVLWLVLALALYNAQVGWGLPAALQSPFTDRLEALCSKAWPLAALLRGLAFFTLVNYCVRREKEERWLKNVVARQLTNIGIFSYSLYLVHYPLIRAMTGLEKQLRAEWGITSVGPFYYAAFFVVLVMLSIMAGKLLFVLVEQRCLPSSGKVPVAGGLYGPAEIAPRTTLLQRLNPFGWLRP
jgi:peptidoglycan/LPS O-acetylase OafA/YrhL